MQSSFHPHSGHYSYGYSANVVDSFMDSYGRVCIFVAKKLYMEPKDFRVSMITAFMDHNTAWQRAREVLKYIHNLDLYDTLSGLTRAECLKYLTVVKVMADDSFAEDGIFRIPT